MISELKLKRRSFLKIAGVAGAANLGLDVGGSVIKALAQGTEAVREEKWVPSVCIVG